MMEKDREAILEMIMEISGARVTIEMALDVLKELNVLDLKDMIFEVAVSYFDNVQ